MDLDSEISQTEKDKYCIIVLMCGIWVRAAVGGNTQQNEIKQTHRYKE